MHSVERTVALPPHLLELLREHRDDQQSRYTEYDWDWEASAFVFDRSDGMFYRPEYTNKLFHQATIAAGVPRIRLHDMRHTAATLMLASGVNVKVVQERMGHHSAGFTLDNYAHVSESMQAEAARKVAEMLGFDAESDRIVTETPSGAAILPSGSGK